MAPMNPTQKLACFIAETTIDDIPEKVLDKSKWLIIDGIAVTLGGFIKVGEKMQSFVRAMGGNPSSGIIGSGLRTNAPLAAYANGTMSHFLDYDDLNKNMGGHPTGPVLSAALAVGELVKATGADLILAYVLGIETETKIGGTIIQSLYGTGWHPTSILGTFGATAASCKLLNLSVEETVMALGIAGSSASGVKQNFGTMTKSLHIGQAAKNGVTAAILAKQGWIADEHILDGPFGLFALFKGEKEYNLNDMTASLGNPWEIVHPGIELKKYPCCASIHSSVDSVFDLMDENPIKVGDIRKVICKVHPDKVHILVLPFPKTGLEGKFSLEYCIAASILHKKIDLDTFTDSRVKEKAVMDFLPCVSTITDASISKWGSQVSIETANGKTITKINHRFPGIAHWAELENKFLNCAVPALGFHQAKKVLKMLKHFENLSQISDLMNGMIQSH